MGMLNDSRNADQRDRGGYDDARPMPAPSTPWAARRSVKVGDVLRGLPHVAIVAPVNLTLNTSGVGIETIYGIDYPSYDALKPFNFLSGGPFRGPTT